MKLKIAMPVIILLITTAVFAVLWQNEVNSKDDYVRLAEYGAKEAYESFLGFQDTGDEALYWDGVASFKQFQQAYYFYVEGTNREGDYTVTNIVYGYMTLHPDAVRERMSQLIDAMKILSEDITHPNGYNKLSVLSNDMRE